MTAWRAGFWPVPACSTWPRMTSPICSPREPGALEQLLDDGGAEFGGRGLGERAAELADGGAGGGDDDDVVPWEFS